MLTVTTVMKTVIGAGILSLPYTISKLGYIFSLIVFALVISLTQFSCYLLLRAKNLSRHSNYSTIMYHIFRSKGSQIFCSLLILLNNLGICKYLLKQALSNWQFLSKDFENFLHSLYPKNITDSFICNNGFLS